MCRRIKCNLVLGKVELKLGGLTRAISRCKSACAPAATAADLIQPVHGGPEPVSGGHIHHAMVHEVWQCCTDKENCTRRPFLTASYGSFGLHVVIPSP